MYTYTSEGAKALKHIKESQSTLVVLGQAGTGKSTWLKHAVSDLENDAFNVAVAAPTGIAALNVGGVTLHSFFRLPTEPLLDLPNQLAEHELGAEREKTIQSMDVLIIDECSMIRADILDAIDFVLKREKDPTKPFGGVRVVLMGDPYQLPPVVVKDEQALFKAVYGSPFFFSAKALKEYQIIEFTKVFRQDGGRFLEILNAIRVGKHDSEMLGELNKTVKSFQNDAVIKVCTTNKRVNGINFGSLKKLDSQEVKYKGYYKGEFNWKDLPTDVYLKLKVGARVMTLVNKDRYVNGSLGTIKELNDDSIIVQLDSGEQAEVKKYTWEKYTYKMEKGRLVKELSGVFTQFPIRLAYAITVHKSQGLTFDKAIIDLGWGGAFLPGQTYVALSRLRSLDGLCLQRELENSSVIVDESVKQFMN